jgi:hypothetical protein
MVHEPKARMPPIHKRPVHSARSQLGIVSDSNLSLMQEGRGSTETYLSIMYGLSVERGTMHRGRSRLRDRGFERGSSRADYMIVAVGSCCAMASIVMGAGGR